MSTVQFHLTMIAILTIIMVVSMIGAWVWVTVDTHIREQKWQARKNVWGQGALVRQDWLRIKGLITPEDRFMIAPVHTDLNELL